MKLKNVLFTTILFLLITFMFSNAQVQSVSKWEVFTVTFQSETDQLNPYAEIPDEKQGDLLEVYFRGVLGEAKGKEIKLVGFWSGGNDWKVNFAPPFSGTWEYKSVSTDIRMNNRTGKLEVLNRSALELEENPTYRGFLMVN